MSEAPVAASTGEAAGAFPEDPGRVSLLLRRLLAGGPGAARADVTAEPPFDDPARRHTAEVVGAMATFSPLPRAARGDSALGPGGGRYGGGGATSDF